MTTAHPQPKLSNTYHLRLVLRRLKKMFNAYFFSLLSTNLRWYVFESFGCGCAVVMNFLYSSISFGWQTDAINSGINNHQNRLFAIFSDQIIDGDIVWMQFRTCVIPSKDSLFSVDLLEHCIHLLKVLVIKVPNRRVFFIFIKRNRKGI